MAGVFSTYLVVENLDNPADFKTVHLCMEVVALKNARPEAPAVSFFHVLVQGSRYEYLYPICGRCTHDIFTAWSRHVSPVLNFNDVYVLSKVQAGTTWRL